MAPQRTATPFGDESPGPPVLHHARIALFRVTPHSAIGLFFGVIRNFLLDTLDTRFRSVAEIESVTGLAPLASIPYFKKATKDGGAATVAQLNLDVLADPGSQFAEAFLSLRTSLLSSTGHPPKTILLTSATPSEGKTTISTNLACVLAQHDARVLLIDADLRRPSIHHRFGINGRIGLTTILTGSTTLEEAIQRAPGVPNLDIIASGPVPPFPIEMLSSQIMTDLLEKLKSLYTHIVIDSPPLLSVDDAVVLALKSDVVVLIVRHSKPSGRIVNRACDLLQQAGAPLTGIALNATEPKPGTIYIGVPAVKLMQRQSASESGTPTA